MTSLRLLTPILLSLVAGCRQTHPQSQPERVMQNASLVHVQWLEFEGERVGSLATYETSNTGPGPVRIIRNQHSQDLGIIDSHGRAWRYQPHRAPQAVSKPTLLGSIQAILGLPEQAELMLGPTQAPPRRLPQGL